MVGQRQDREDPNGILPAAPATRRQHNLTPAELWMCKTAAAGAVVSFDERFGPTDVMNGYGWTPERSLRADVILALLLGAIDGYPLTAKGLRIDGARIVGRLDC